MGKSSVRGNKKIGILFFLLLLVTLILFIVISSMNISFASSEYEDEANTLNKLGLFSGTNVGYELERAPKRVEALAMLVKLLGYEVEAKTMNYSHPFTDVPSWADAYVGIMYKLGFTKGVGNNLFGSDQLMKSKDFATFSLIALGYDLEDFEYNSALAYARDIGLLTEADVTSLSSGAFLRGEMVDISLKTLNTPLKSGSNRLIDQLVTEGIVDPKVAAQMGLMNAVDAGDAIKKEGTLVYIPFTRETDGYLIITSETLKRIFPTVSTFEVTSGAGPKEEFLKNVKNHYKYELSRPQNDLFEIYSFRLPEAGKNQLIFIYDKDYNILAWANFDAALKFEADSMAFDTSIYFDFLAEKAYAEQIWTSKIPSDVPYFDSSLIKKNEIIDSTSRAIEVPFDLSGLPDDLFLAKYQALGYSPSGYDKASLDFNFKYYVLHFLEYYTPELDHEKPTVWLSNMPGYTNLILLFDASGKILGYTLVKMD